MGYDRGRRRGRDKRDGFGEDSFDPFGGGDFPPRDNFGQQDRFGGGGRGFGDWAGFRGVLTAFLAAGAVVSTACLLRSLVPEKAQ